MLKIRFIFLIIIFFKISLIAQLNENFTDGDFLINPVWEGDLQDFIVNTDYQLQLDAADGGESILYTEFEKFDSIEWGFYFKMDFTPSNSNKIKIYLLLDKANVTDANGYFIEIGENGSDDKINFYTLSNGNASILGEGNLGTFSTEPAYANIKVIRDAYGFWQIFIKKDDGFFHKELELYDNDYWIDNPIFLLNCKYTTTRKNKFFFDDIYIKEFHPDTEPPNLVEAFLQNKRDLYLVFDEELSEENIFKPTNYSIVSTELLPNEIVYDQSTPNKVLLKYDREFESGLNYEISVLGIKDIYGNEIIDLHKASFFLIESPEINDIVINEILFNPNIGGNDFLELYNVSKKFLNLNGLSISNKFKETNPVFLVHDYILKRGEYVCLTNDSIDIINNYFIPDSTKFIYSKLPSFDDKNGNISISILDSSKSDLILIDSFDYNEDMHSSFITDNEGISLERKNPLISTNDKFNWNSASTIIGGATPGYKNSNYFELTNNTEYGLQLLNKKFSPNFDNIEDELQIQYNFENSNNLSNINILDSKGRLIKQLINNETLGKQGLIFWDGYIEKQLAPIGIYILLYQILDENGNSLKGKKVFVLADYLK